MLPLPVVNDYLKLRGLSLETPLKRLVLQHFRHQNNVIVRFNGMGCASCIRLDMKTDVLFCATLLTLCNRRTVVPLFCDYLWEMENLATLERRPFMRVILNICRVCPLELWCIRGVTSGESDHGGVGRNLSSGVVLNGIF